MKIQEQIQLFQSLFHGLEKGHGTCDPLTGCVRGVEAPAKEQVISNHLQEMQPYGLFLVKQDRHYADPWKCLLSIQRIHGRHVDRLFERNDQVQPSSRPDLPRKGLKRNNRGFGLSLCAQRILQEGAANYQCVI